MIHSKNDVVEGPEEKNSTNLKIYKFKDLFVSFEYFI